MKPILLSLLGAAVISQASAQIAVTEFLSNPRIPDSDGEFIELFNFSADPVNLNGWSIADEDNDADVISDSDLFIESGGYLVVAKNKPALEAAFFNGVDQPNIIEVTGLTLANGGDEIILLNGSGATIWSIAYGGGGPNGNAVFLSEDNFSVTIWGSKAEPGIDFSDIDPASGRLSFQDNSVTTDPNATSTDGDDPDTASPLAGFYTVSDGGGPVISDFRITSIVPGTLAGNFDISFPTEAGTAYTIDGSPDLETDFEPIDGAVIPGTGGELTVTVTPPAGSTRFFYRIQELTILGPGT